MKGNVRLWFGSVFGLCGLTAAVLGIGYGSFVAPYTVDESASSTVSSDINQGTTKTIDVRYLYAESAKTNTTTGINLAWTGSGTSVSGYSWSDATSRTTYSVSDITTLNQVSYAMRSLTNGFNYRILSTDPSDDVIIADTGTYILWGNDGTNYEGCRISLKVTTKIGYYEASTCDSNREYYGEYYLTYDRTTVETTYDYASMSSELTIEVPTGSVFPRQEIYEQLDGTTNLSLRGFLLGDSGGSTSSTFIEDDYVVSSDIVVYALMVGTVMNPSGSYLLAGTINETSSGTIGFNAFEESGVYDLRNDKSYVDDERFVYLGDKTNGGATIQSGVTVNFELNSGHTYLANKFGYSYSYIEPENAYHALQYCVVLQEDLTINGTMTIGSNYGVAISSGAQGMIVSEYVCLDLNGHTITVGPSGTLTSYGLIKDSKGTGKIVVNGGTITTLAVVHDYRGGAVTYQMNNVNEFPFQIYAIPYIRCKVELNYSTTNSSIGKFNAIANICVQTTSGTTVSDIELKFIGSTSDYLFQIGSSGVNGGSPSVLISGNQDKNVAGTLAYSSVIKYMSMDWRLEIRLRHAQVTMNAIKFTMENVLLDRDVTVDTSKMNFPIASFFDIYLESSYIRIAQRIRMLPGSSLVGDGDSIIYLDSGAQVSVIDRPYYYYDWTAGKNITMDQARIDGSNGAYLTGSLWTQTRVWQYYSGSTVRILGRLVFVQGSSYTLAGNMDFGRIAYAPSAFSTSITEIEYGDGNPFGMLPSGTSVTTQGFDYMIGSAHFDGILGVGAGGRASHMKGYSRPLTSYGVSYANYGLDYLVGTWDDKNGVFAVTTENESGTVTTTNYMFNCVRNSTGSAYSWKSNDTDGCTMMECTLNDDHTITAGGDTYIFFASMYFDYSNRVATIPARLVSAGGSLNVAWDSSSRWLRTS